MFIAGNVRFRFGNPLFELSLCLLPGCFAQFERSNLGQEKFSATAKKVLFNLDGDKRYREQGTEAEEESKEDLKERA